MKKILSLMSIFVLSLMVFVPHSSAQSNQLDNGYIFDESFTQAQIDRIVDVVESEEFQKEAEEALSLRPYVDATGDLIVFDHTKALEDGLDSSLVLKARETYNKANEYLEQQQPRYSLLAAKSNCQGLNKYDGNLVAGTIYMDSCKTAKMIAIMMGGGTGFAALALIPFVPTQIMSGVAVAIFGAGATVLQWNSADGTGVKINVLRNPVNGDWYPYWVKPQ